MGDENVPKPYKQRFKGVENFLRRVAFNLGNTPSQTEVKIISCIPIDVTDLQQKIINLEKQLCEAQRVAYSRVHLVSPPPLENSQDKEEKEEQDEKKCKEINQGPTTVVNAAFVRRSSGMCSLNNKKPTRSITMQEMSAYCEDCASRQRKSNVSFVFPATTTLEDQACCSRDRCDDKEEEELQNNIGDDLCKNIFRRRKKKRIIGTKSKIKTQFVYYSQESPKNPFHLYDKILLKKQIVDQKDQLGRSYLDDLVRRQYDPKMVLEEYSDTSHFSKPICRDIKDNLNLRCVYESDVCSCCQGKFHNLDNFITNSLCFDHINTSALKRINRETYYDSDLYDMVPVRDSEIAKPDVLHKKEYKNHLNVKCLPEKYRSKCRYHPFVIKHHSEIPTRGRNHKKDYGQRRTKRERINKNDRRDDFDTSKSCCIECSDVYTKPGTTPGINLRKSEPTRKIILKNETVETDVRTSIEANNRSTQSRLLPPDENKTESTLNQIKTILQSVLQEVKTNSNINTVTETHKKDAIVQKGSSQNNMGNSTLLNSFTYNNSCNVNSGLPSSSRQMSAGAYCFPGVSCQPMKCLQNYPVFIHPATGRQMCACYYRHSSHKTSHNKQATTTATNTERKIKESYSNETEKLIKEIYKSMALNMDYPTKENSSSDCDDLKSTGVNSINEYSKEEKCTEVDALNKRDIEIEAILTPPISNRNEGHIVYTGTSTQSEDKTLASDVTFGFTPIRNINLNDSSAKRAERLSNDTIEEVEDESYESSDEAESDVVVPKDSKQNKKEKGGLFKRMFNSVKIFKKRKGDQSQRNESDEEVSEESDFDEYQAMKSPRNGKGTTKQKIPPYTRKYYSKGRIGLDQRSYGKSKRSPYLEQEYRRQWNERIMFNNQQLSYSSERPFSRPSTSQPIARPVYWKNYETRSALVEQNLPSNVMPLHQNTTGGTEKGYPSPIAMAESDEKRGKLAWIKKHKLGFHCGEQWKKFILEN